MPRWIRGLCRWTSSLPARKPIHSRCGRNLRIPRNRSSQIHNPDIRQNKIQSILDSCQSKIQSILDSYQSRTCIPDSYQSRTCIPGMYSCMTLDKFLYNFLCIPDRCYYKYQNIQCSLDNRRNRFQCSFDTDRSTFRSSPDRSLGRFQCSLDNHRNRYPYSLGKNLGKSRSRFPCKYPYSCQCNFRSNWNRRNNSRLHIDLCRRPHSPYHC